MPTTLYYTMHTVPYNACSTIQCIEYYTKYTLLYSTIQSIQYYKVDRVLHYTILNSIIKWIEYSTILYYTLLSAILLLSNLLFYSPAPAQNGFID